LSGAPLRIATRRSPLALAQAEWVARALAAAGARCELLKLETEGDLKLDGPLHESGGKGLFVKEIQRALLEGEADFAVHSGKDYPHQNPPQLRIAAVPERESTADLLLTLDGRALPALPAGARVGSASQRRRGQLLALRPDLRIELLRGNVGSRLRKLEAGEFDAIVLAEAGLRRLGLDAWRARASVLPILAAAAQGALVIETRRDDGRARALADGLNHPATAREVEAERAFVAGLGGDCTTPIGARAMSRGDTLVSMSGLLIAPDGSRAARVEADEAELASPPAALGAALARRLRALPGADPLLPSR